MNSSTPAWSYSPAVGVSEFVKSNGSVQREPAYTGGNGTNGDAGDASTSSDAASKNGAVRLAKGGVGMAGSSGSSLSVSRCCKREGFTDTLLLQCDLLHHSESCDIF